MIEKYIRQLWIDLEVDEDFPEPDHGRFAIPVDEDELLIVKEMAENEFSVFAVVVDMPEGNAEAFVSSAMRANLFGEATGDAVLGMDPEAKHLILSQHLRGIEDYDDFVYHLEDFTNWLEYWRGEVDTIEKQAKPFM